MSPFAITRGQKGSTEDPEFSEFEGSRSKDSSKSQKLKRWLSMATLSRKRVLLPVKKLRTSLLANSKLHRTLYGFIVFEVVWKDVRGINYLNELQVFLVPFPYIMGGKLDRSGGSCNWSKWVFKYFV